MTTALLMTLCPSHSFPNLMAVVAAVAFREIVKSVAKSGISTRRIHPPLQKKTPLQKEGSNMCLELIFQRKLDDPWRDRRCLNYTEGRRRRAGVAGISKVRMVENIEEFCAE